MNAQDMFDMTRAEWLSSLWPLAIVGIGLIFWIATKLIKK